MFFLVSILAFFCLLQPPAYAQTVEEAVAEQSRLRGELVRLYRNQTWKGVERLYGKMVELEEHGAVLTADDHMYGVMSAQELGMLLETVERLRRIASIRPGSSESEWLERLEAGCGMVELTVGRSEGAVLEAAELPFEPELQLAIQFASAQLELKGAFSGLLPAGTYSYAGHSFEVVPGNTSFLLIRGRSAAVQPRWSVGIGPGVVRMGGSPEGLGPQSFLAGGGTVGLGIEKSFGRFLVSSEAALQGGYQPSGHLIGGSVLLRTGFRWKGLALSAGPVFNISHGRQTGILPAEAVRACPGCLDVRALAESSVMEAWPRTGGGVVDAEFSLDGWAISFRGGARTDGMRWYQEAGTMAVFRFGEAW